MRSSESPVGGAVSRARASNNRKEARVVIRVAGTSPLSFDATIVTIGTILEVREFAPSSHSRPSVNGGFKKSGYLLFADRTKVGRLSPASIKKFSSRVPPSCTVVEVDKDRKRLSVVFH